MAVPMAGDWYGRKMCQQNQADYTNHLERWSHPSTTGWEAILPLWNAENFLHKSLFALPFDQRHGKGENT